MIKIRSTKRSPADLISMSEPFAPMFLVLGPCAFEGREHCLDMAEAIAKIALRLDRIVVFKTSFYKANRTRRDSYRGRGLDETLKTFTEIREKFGLPVLTDVHETWQCKEVAPHVDILQIPALLSRQTDLLQSAGATSLCVNIKKGQFMSPEDMRWAVEKVRFAGGKPMVCERGTFFGYGDLINDFRSLGIMRQQCLAPVIFDATHSAQRSDFNKGITGGNRNVVSELARAAVAVGIDGLFIETHNDPNVAPSDGATMIPLQGLEAMLLDLIALDDFVKSLLKNA